MVLTANLGFPRVGADRELKRALERHWRGDLDREELLSVARDLRARHWRLQQGIGIDHVPSNDFSLYDHVLDTAWMVGGVPEGLADGDDEVGGSRYFALARGGTVEGEARRLLEHLGLDAEQVASQPASTLSVGQQQRAAAARALIGTPEIVVADEPTSALDRDRQRDFLDLLFGEVSRVGATLVMVSHDESLAPQFDAVVPLAEIARIQHGPQDRA